MFFDEQLIDIENWCPLDDRPLEAPLKKDPEPISRGNMLQVPQFLRSAPIDFLIEEFLELEKIENLYFPSEGKTDDFIEACDSEVEGFQFEPLPLFRAMLPQSTEQQENQEIEEEGVKIFNNMPGFLISALQSFQEQLEHHDFGSSRINVAEKVKKCSQEMILQILMKLSSKQGNREQLRMFFNDIVAGKFSDSLKKKALNKKVIKKYFQLEQKYGPEVMAETKSELREVFCNIMTKEWMHCHSQNRKFGGKKVEMKKKVFYKYLVSFAQQLYEGEIQSLINREKVLSVELFQKQ